MKKVRGLADFRLPVPTDTTPSMHSGQQFVALGSGVQFTRTNEAGYVLYTLPAVSSTN